ncbi:MAG: purine-nucleoside phosphorylase, partial [Pseudomonadales bacterium]
VDIREAAEAIRQRTKIAPRVGVILGSGLGSITEAVEEPVIIPYAEIPYFPVSSAPSHKGQLCIGTLYGAPVVLMQGRIHLYEGYTPQQVTFPIRVMQELGVETLLVTNAAGGVNESYQVGDLMMIEDHINLVGMSGLDPMRGPQVPELGARFTSLNGAYDPAYMQAIDTLAAKAQLNVHRGVYAFLVGPSFETAAEIRFLSSLGADAVGMSTVPEVMVARNAGIRVLAISAITNISIHETSSIEETTEEEVWETIEIAIPKLTKLIAGFLKTLA